MARPLMRAQWLDLLLLSYRVERALLEPLLPDGLRLDEWQGSAYVSVVAFDFRRVRMWGLPIPGNTDFPEWNLRFYVREKTGEERRGVVFIKEIVPKPLVSLGAKWLYNEPYETRPIRIDHGQTPAGDAFTHTLKHGKNRMTISWSTGRESTVPPEESEPHFFKEHSWGYGTTRRGRTLVYRVHHPVWSVRDVHELEIDVDGRALYGEPWSFIGTRDPDSVVFAEGSDIEVYPGEPLLG